MHVIFELYDQGLRFPWLNASIHGFYPFSRDFALYSLLSKGISTFFSVMPHVDQRLWEESSGRLNIKILHFILYWVKVFLFFFSAMPHVDQRLWEESSVHWILKSYSTSIGFYDTVVFFWECRAYILVVSVLVIMNCLKSKEAANVMFLNWVTQLP